MKSETHRMILETSMAILKATKMIFEASKVTSGETKMISKAFMMIKDDLKGFEKNILKVSWARKMILKASRMITEV